MYTKEPILNVQVVVVDKRNNTLSTKATHLKSHRTVVSTLSFIIQTFVYPRIYQYIQQIGYAQIH